jgi:hypothetical protein
MCPWLKVNSVRISTLSFFRFFSGTKSPFKTLPSDQNKKRSDQDVFTKLTRDITATLLKLAQTTSDPNVAAALINKAADIKDRLDDGAPLRRESVVPLNIIQKQ